ncbi:MAG: AGE family epimerase/isomerase [Bacteroidaceae bacterium]|nr:AGE family epimerase/isomerase [Bacteroidaceae bacterium]
MDTVKDYLQTWASRYRADLVDNIMPFWLQHGLDSVNGGVYTCLDRDGTLMDGTKSVWFQGRFGFIAAYAYNNIEPRAEWLEASRSCIDFIEKHCFDSDGHMFFTVTADGQPVQKRRYVFSECFAIIAMAEYALASGDRSYAEKALALFHRTRKMLATPGFLPPKTTQKGYSHSITMMFFNVVVVLRKVINDPSLLEQLKESLRLIESYLLKPEYKTILESVDEEGNLIDTLAGRVINPGHCIETAWFLMEAAPLFPDAEHVRKLGLQILDWDFEWGWDKEYGGIINFRDCRNFPPQDYSQDMKFWWPQCETIIASLYAYKLTRDERYLRMHKQASEWAYAHFADEEFGEWYGYLHRDGSVAQPAKGNIFKGPFHVPRMMIKSYLLCNEILASSL